MSASGRSPLPGIVALFGVGTSLILLAAAMPASPLVPPLPPGGAPFAIFTRAAHALGLATAPDLWKAALAMVGLIVFSTGFWLSIRSARSGALSLRAVVAVSVGLNAAALALPLLGSRDVYSYALYGRLVALHHANPYLATPASVPGDPMTRLILPLWRHTPSVYGPAFAWVSALVAAVARSPAGLVLAFKLVSAVASVATLLLVVRTTRRRRPELAPYAAALFGLNPVVILWAVGGGHMDTLVALAVAGALALVLGGEPDTVGRPFCLRDAGATACLTVAALLKAPALVPLGLFIVWTVARRAKGLRLRAFIGEIGVVAAISIPIVGPFFQTRDLTFGLRHLYGYESLISAIQIVGNAIGPIGRALAGVGAGNAEVRLASASLFLLAIYVIGRLAIDVGRRAGEISPEGLGRAWGLGLLVLTLSSPLLFPWYLVWTLPAAWLLPRRPRDILVVLSVLLPLAQIVAEPAHVYALAQQRVDVYVVSPIVLLAVLWIDRSILRRVRGERPDVWGQVAARVDLDARSGSGSGAGASAAAGRRT